MKIGLKSINNDHRVFFEVNFMFTPMFHSSTTHLVFIVILPILYSLFPLHSTLWQIRQPHHPAHSAPFCVEMSKSQPTNFCPFTSSMLLPFVGGIPLFFLIRPLREYSTPKVIPFTFISWAHFLSQFSQRLVIFVEAILCKIHVFLRLKLDRKNESKTREMQIDPPQNARAKSGDF